MIISMFLLILIQFNDKDKLTKSPWNMGFPCSSWNFR